MQVRDVLAALASVQPAASERQGSAAAAPLPAMSNEVKELVQVCERHEVRPFATVRPLFVSCACRQVKCITMCSAGQCS